MTQLSLDGGFTHASLTAAGWTDQQMIDNGYAIMSS